MHWARRAASRADWTAGSNRAMSTAMMAMTTNSSISVKPRRFQRGFIMRFSSSGGIRSLVQRKIRLIAGLLGDIDGEVAPAVVAIGDDVLPRHGLLLHARREFGIPAAEHLGGPELLGVRLD